MACWCRNRSASPIDRLAGKLFGAALALLWTSPLAAQSAATDARLKELIPDTAVADPQAWARAATPAPPSGPDPGDLKPDSPMSDLPGIELAWPDTALALPSLPSLAPEGEVVSLQSPARGVVPMPTGSDLAQLAPVSHGDTPTLHDAFSGGRLRLSYAVALEWLR